MFCSKIGAECPHEVKKDENYVFVLMPFKGFDSVYDAIEMALEKVGKVKFVCDRADKKYTNVSIWCKRICMNIRKSKYCIVDTTGKNANVFYELGFAHALAYTKPVIITQSVEEAPFDIKDIGAIEYSEKNLPKLRERLREAILKLEKEEDFPRQSPEEIAAALRVALKEEEQRAANYNRQLRESEEREGELDQRLKEMEAILNNPIEVAKSKIKQLSVKIAELGVELEYTEKDDEQKVGQLRKDLGEKKAELASLRSQFNKYEKSKNSKPVSDSLMAPARLEAQLWLYRGDEQKKVSIEDTIMYYSKAIELYREPIAYYNRGNTYFELSRYSQAIEDYSDVVRLDWQFYSAYCKRGECYFRMGDFDSAIRDFNKTIEMNPHYYPAYVSRGECYFRMGDFDSAIRDYSAALGVNPEYYLAYYHRGDSYFRLSRLDYSIRDYTAASTLMPTDDLSAYKREIASVCKAIGQKE